MHSVNLQAGHLSVSVQTDSDEVTLNDCVSAAHVELDWIIDQHSTIDGKMVGIEHPDPTFGGR